MEKEDSTRSIPKRAAPKRGAFPTPRSVLAGATPFEAEKRDDQSGFAADQSRSDPPSPEESGSSGIGTGGIAMSDESGSASYVGTAGTPPRPSGATAAGPQAGSGTQGTAGTPPRPSGTTAAGSQGGAGYVGTAGTPPRPSGGTAAGSQAGTASVGTAGTPPRK